MIRLFPDGIPTGTGLQRESTPARKRTFPLNSPEFLRLFSSSIFGSGIVSTSEAWKNSVWVRACLEATANKIAQLPFQIYKGDDPVEKHGVLDLLEKPNAILGLSRVELIMQTVLIRELFGECFWLLGRGGKRGAVSEIWIYNPAGVEEIKDRRTGELLAWQFSLEGQRLPPTDPLDVAHFPRYDPLRHNPTRPTRGTSALQSAGIATSADLAAARYNLGFFERGAVPDGIVWTEQDVDTDTSDAIIARFKAKLQGKAHEPIFLGNGLQWVPTHTTPRESEFIEGRKLNREEICAALKVPPFVVGIGDTANFANSRQAMRNWWQVSLQPIIASVCAVIDSKVINEPNTSCTLSTDSVEELQENKKEKTDIAVQLWGMGVPYNSIDKLLEIGTGPVPGGEIGYLPFSVQPVGAASQDEDPDADALAQDDEGDLLARMIRSVRLLEPAIDVKALPADSRGKKKDDRIGGVLDVILSDDKKLKKLMEPLLKQGYQIGIDQGASMLGVDISFTLKNPRAVAFIQDKVIKLSQVTDTTTEAIRKILAAGLEEGLSNADIAKEIRAKYNDFTDYRAGLIARTETSQAVNGARYQVTVEEGVETHEWVTSADDRVRESHQAEDGHVVNVGEEFPVTNLLYPGDPEGEPEEVILCRCLTIAVAFSRALRIDKAEYWRGAVNEWASVERQMKKKLRSFFFNQRASVLEAVAAIK